MAGDAPGISFVTAADAESLVAIRVETMREQRRHLRKADGRDMHIGQ